MVVMVMDVGDIVVVMVNHFRILKNLYFLFFHTIRTFLHVYVQVFDELLTRLFCILLGIFFVGTVRRLRILAV